MDAMNKRTIIITGTSSGLGKALFDILHHAGVRLICISRTFPEYQTALSNRNLVLLTCDLSQKEDVLRLTQKLGQALAGEHEVLFINNAATIAPIGLVGKLDEAALIAAAHTNFVSPMLITNALCALKKTKRLTLIHVSTGAARMSIVGWALYCSTKAACKMFFSVVEEQYKESKNVTVHQFDPGVIDTPMQKKIRQSSSRDFPRVGEFKSFKKTRELSDPLLVAKRLIKQYIPI